MLIDDAQIQLRVDRKAAHFRAEASGGTVQLVASPLQVSARCQVEPDFSYRIAPEDFMSRTSPRDAPWKLGFMQVQILETAWAYYRGAQSADGCQLNGRPVRGFRLAALSVNGSEGQVVLASSRHRAEEANPERRRERHEWRSR
jgi:hypothetical protein